MVFKSRGATPTNNWKCLYIRQYTSTLEILETEQTAHGKTKGKRPGDGYIIPTCPMASNSPIYSCDLIPRTTPLSLTAAAEPSCSSPSSHQQTPSHNPTFCLASHLFSLIVATREYSLPAQDQRQHWAAAENTLCAPYARWLRRGGHLTI